jgi:hypothetical protein
MKDVLGFISTLIWQVVLICCLWSARAEIRAMLRRVVRFKYGDAEAVFQEQVSEPPEPSPLVVQAMKVRDEEGFFTKAGIEELIKQSNYLTSNENVRESMLVFSTARQHTWLVTTSLNVFFVLDDEKTRTSERLVQKFLPLSKALPVNAQQESENAGSFQLGGSPYWYYSMHILGSPKTAVRRLTSFIETAKVR